MRRIRRKLGVRSRAELVTRLTLLIYGGPRETLCLDGESLIVWGVDDRRSPIEELPPALRDVALRAIEGWSTTRIAEARGRSPRTIANQLARIYGRPGIGSRAELAALAARGPTPASRA